MQGERAAERRNPRLPLSSSAAVGRQVLATERQASPLQQRGKRHGDRQCEPAALYMFGCVHFNANVYFGKRQMLPMKMIYIFLSRDSVPNVLIISFTVNTDPWFSLSQTRLTVDSMQTECTNVKAELQDHVTSGVSAHEEYSQRIVDSCTQQITDVNTNQNLFYKHSDVSRAHFFAEIAYLIFTGPKKYFVLCFL